MEKIKNSGLIKVENIFEFEHDFETAIPLEILYNILKDNSEEVLYLLLDLISLAKIDGEFHITEKLFIKEVAKTLNFNQDELISLIES